MPEVPPISPEDKYEPAGITPEDFDEEDRRVPTRLDALHRQKPDGDKEKLPPKTKIY